MPQTIRRTASRLDPDYFFARGLRAKLGLALAQVQNGNGKSVLDVGCGNKPYRHLFGAVTSYVGTDVVRSEYSDVISYAESLPFDSDKFDIVLCTQVLEHCLAPSVVISEFARVLKPNGLLLLSTHGMYPVHGEPFDYYRWTEYGLRFIMKDLDLISVVPVQGVFESMAILANTVLWVLIPKAIAKRFTNRPNIFPTKAMRYDWSSQGQGYSTKGYLLKQVLSPLFGIVNYTASALEILLGPTVEPTWVETYLVISRKPKGGHPS